MATTASSTYYSQDQVVKNYYRVIMKQLHPDMNPGRKPTEYEMSLLYQAQNAYVERDVVTLKKIFDTLMNPKTGTSESKKKEMRTTFDSMVDFFRSQGVEVIDKRDKGGCLWVVGKPSEIDHIVKRACRMFHAGGNYAMNGGRASGYRTAWFTKCGR